jgi:penicillin G amidase
MAGPASAWCDDVNTADKKETLADIVRRSIDSTLVFMNNQYGRDSASWKWGNLHTITLEHPMGKVKILDLLFSLNRGPFAVSGASHTVEPYSYPVETAFKANHGASHRHIYTLENWDNSQTVIPTGNSGVPASRNYCDQTSLYIGNQYHGEYFSEEKVKEHAKFTMILK